MSRVIVLPNIDNLIRRYIAGESEKKLSLECGISRGAFRHQLIKQGIKPRNRSDSMYARMRLTLPEERSRLATAAHDALRGKKRTIVDLSTRAKGRERTLACASETEFIFIKMLKERGCINLTHQKAVGKYNIDIALNELRIAVEISGNCDKVNGTTSAIPARFGKRTPYLLNEGWHVIIITIDNIRNRLTTGAADYIVSLCDEFRRNPPIECQYRVIRGNGQLKTFLSLEYQHGARIPGTERGLKPSKIQDVPW